MGKRKQANVCEESQRKDIFFEDPDPNSEIYGSIDKPQYSELMDGSVPQPTEPCIKQMIEEPPTYQSSSENPFRSDVSSVQFQTTGFSHKATNSRENHKLSKNEKAHSSKAKPIKKDKKIKSSCLEKQKKVQNQGQLRRQKKPRQKKEIQKDQKEELDEPRNRPDIAVDMSQYNPNKKSIKRVNISYPNGLQGEKYLKSRSYRGHQQGIKYKSFLFVMRGSLFNIIQQKYLKEYNQLINNNDLFGILNNRKTHMSMLQYSNLCKIEELQGILGEIFAKKILCRKLMLSRASPYHKKLYMGKIKLLEDTFRKQQKLEKLSTCRKRN